jgi:hypothetical protein
MRVPKFLITQTCLIKTYLGQTPTGPKYATQYESGCRFEAHRGKYTDPKGKEFISNAKIFLPPDNSNIALTIDSAIIVDGVQYLVKQKMIHRGFSISHIECVVV